MAVAAALWIGGAACGADNAGVLDTGGMTIYEANIRQSSPEGTFEAFRRELPRLAKIGVGVVWLMPIHPIGEVNRKGTLGSYYAVRDYTAVNPEFGTAEDLHRLVNSAHFLGMRVIIDWVANHASWDNTWTVSHPERFTKGPDGGFVPPNPDWSDVIDLNYDDPGTRAAMREAMEFWVRQFDIDGFRCDVADDVPADFWAPTIEALRAIKPVFMLAEADAAWMYDAGFDATYGWGVADTVGRIVKGEEDAGAVRTVVHADTVKMGGNGDRFRMNFTTNHDWNSWVGTAKERLGPAWEAATVLSFTLPGMPLIYSGQEAGLDKRVEFFEKDVIAWRDDPAAALYAQLCAAKKDEPALRHGADAGAIEFLDVGDVKRVVAFRRLSGDSEVVVAVNLSDAPATLGGGLMRAGVEYANIDGKPSAAPDRLEAWGWTVLVAKR